MCATLTGLYSMYYDLMTMTTQPSRGTADFHVCYGVSTLSKTIRHLQAVHFKTHKGID